MIHRGDLNAGYRLRDLKGFQEMKVDGLIVQVCAVWSNRNLEVGSTMIISHTNIHKERQTGEHRTHKGKGKYKK